MFEPYAAAETNFTALDPRSIMMYPIPAGWTTDGFSVGLNTDLSATDEQFDNVTLSDLQAGKITLTSSTITFTYGTSAISLNDGSSNLTVGYAFAIKTGLGRYVKVHVGDIITRGSDTAKRDLALEVYVYR